MKKKSNSLFHRTHSRSKNVVCRVQNARAFSFLWFFSAKQRTQNDENRFVRNVNIVIDSKTKFGFSFTSARRKTQTNAFYFSQTILSAAHFISKIENVLGAFISRRCRRRRSSPHSVDRPDTKWKRSERSGRLNNSKKRKTKKKNVEKEEEAKTHSEQNEWTNRKETNETKSVSNDSTSGECTRSKYIAFERRTKQTTCWERCAECVHGDYTRLMYGSAQMLLRLYTILRKWRQQNLFHSNQIDTMVNVLLIASTQTGRTVDDVFHSVVRLFVRSLLRTYDVIATVDNSVDVVCSAQAQNTVKPRHIESHDFTRFRPNSTCFHKRKPYEKFKN